MEPVRFGVISTAKIGIQKVIPAMQQSARCRVLAIASRDLTRARAAADALGIPRAYGSYAELLQDAEIEAVYNPLPNHLHVPISIEAAAAGKHVLCEKPLTVTLAEAEELVATARRTDRFLMEAMWTACNPVVRQVVDGLRAGRFGTPRQLHADLGWVVDAPPDDRLVDPALGAGALLDLGVYPLTMAHLVLGPVEQVVATATLDAAGIDLDVAMATRHAGGAVGALTASMTSHSPRTATVATDTGRLELPESFHHPAYARWLPADGEPELLTGVEPLLGTGLGNEAAEVQRCVRAGLRESPLVPHEQTLSLMAVMDDVRRQVGVRYAADS